AFEEAGSRARLALATSDAKTAATLPEATVQDDPNADAPAWLRWLWQRVSARHVLILLGLLVFPLVATPFFTFQIAAQSLVLGMIALSLTFLAGYGGMISLAQMTVAGIAGYAVAILGV